MEIQKVCKNCMKRKEKKCKVTNLYVPRKKVCDNNEYTEKKRS